jgi:hypothetical protein
MADVYHIVIVRVIWTSWAHVWRLRFRFLVMGYGKWYQSQPSRFHGRVWVSWERYGGVRVRDVGTYAWCVGPLGGTRYGTYAANWMYDTHMSVLDVRTWPRGDVAGLGLTDEDIDILRGVDCDILTQGLIGLTEYSYHQGITSFSEAQLQITLGLNVLSPEQFQDGWPTGKFSWVCTSEDKSAQKRLGLVCGASLWS